LSTLERVLTSRMEMSCITRYLWIVLGVLYGCIIWKLLYDTNVT
jgi:hypothetical protein